ncbi:MAG: efflux RND transporter periplasmic adaptor subunit [Lachnospiraceae bacterium]|nr:efflux RND transporter periplasmic adaptor subunit [Lachnospiraceae bacterium]
MKNQGGRGQMQAPPQMNDMGEGVISATGLTSAGMLEETWELDFLTTSLYVEESYLSTGDEVASGTAVFKVSEETLTEAREELEDKVTEADLAYRQGLIDYETDAIDARVTSETAAVNQAYAGAEYDSAAAQAKMQVETLEQQVEEAKELVDEYTKSQTEDYYRSYYKVDELYQIYYEHFTLLMEYYEKWDIETYDDQYGSSSGSVMNMSMEQSSQISVMSLTSTFPGQESNAQGSGANTGGQGGFSFSDGGGDRMGGYDENQSKVSVYNMLDEMVQEEGAAYKVALENYENAKAKAAAGLDQAVSNLAALEAELTQAKAEYEKALISCQADYQTTLAESENAGTVYETTMQSLEETLAALEDDKEEAEENLALFEEVIGDGYFYTNHAGTIVMNGIRRNMYLSGESMVVAYSNPEEVTVSASVDQSNIAQISVGDSVYVVVSEYGNYTGKVTQINPVTQAESRSSVTYQVTVELEGDVSTLESNLTAYLYFGMTEEMIQQMEGNTSGGSRPEGGGMPGEMPEGMDMENMPEMPEGMDMENMPEMPEGTDMENMPEMPEGMDMENMPKMPEGMDMENMPEMPEGMDFGERSRGRGSNDSEMGNRPERENNRSNTGVTEGESE